MTTLFIDADACPVKAEALRVGLRHRARVVMVSNGGIRPSAYPGAEVVVVERDPQSAEAATALLTEQGETLNRAVREVFAKLAMTEALLTESRERAAGRLVAADDRRARRRDRRRP